MKTGGEGTAFPLARLVFAFFALLALAGCAGGLPDIRSMSVFGGSDDSKREADRPVNLAELIMPGPLDDIAIGKANAPVTIVQYASLNCESCGKFQSHTFPKLKKAYIDKGKARFVFREFPEDNASTTAALAVRCVGERRYFRAMKAVLTHQKDWAGPEAKVDALYRIVRRGGLKRRKFDACLADKTVSDGLAQEKKRAGGFGVTVSPTFFVNGKKLVGAVSFEEMQAVIDAAYAATQAPAAG